MCITQFQQMQQAPSLGLAFSVYDEILEYGMESFNRANAKRALDAQYTSNLVDLEHSQAKARLGAQDSIRDATTSRKNQQLEAAQEGGKSKAGFGASGLALDGGNIKQLMLDHTSKTQATSSEITRRMNDDVKSHRMDELHYGDKKNILRQEYSRKKKELQAKNFLTDYNKVKNTLLDFENGFRSK